MNRGAVLLRMGMVLYALTIFVGAFLLFQVQPLIAKYTLPWFGGGPAVWTTAMLFFQVVLLGGYAYAHVSIRRFTPKVQAAVHLALLAVALTQLPITPAETWKPTAADLPTWRILLLLTATIGFPYMVLSSTAPLLQSWFSRVHGNRSPYRLYALSNLGSLLALVSYPFVVEPLLTRIAQVVMWSTGFGLFAVACGVCAVWIWRMDAGPVHTADRADSTLENTSQPTLGVRALWLTLATCAAVLLLAVTNQITVDIAVVPFLWVLPLSLYLLTFVIAFDHRRWYVRPFLIVALAPVMIVAVWLMFRAQAATIGQQLFGYSAVLFVGCMICHGELSRLKPDPRHLTGYYLTIALGGALGGAFVTVVAPLIFNDYWELHLALIGVCGLALAVWYRDPASVLHRARPVWAWGGMAMCMLVLSAFLGKQAVGASMTPIARSRNFYGVLAVLQENQGTLVESRWLRHGRIPHGIQFTAPALQRLATGYFSARSGVGLALQSFPRQSNRRIGMVGMGVGTLATYAHQGDYVRVYEIDPNVRHLNETYFTYLRDSPAAVEVVMGDARLSLERDPPQEFDFLLLDAFSGDAIPLHLLTREAFETYRRHLKPDGVLAILIATWHLDFGPVVRALADHFGMDAVRIETRPGDWQDWGADWMIVTHNHEFLETYPIAYYAERDHPRGSTRRLWTDDFTSLFQLMWH